MARCILAMESTGKTGTVDLYPADGAAGERGPWQIHPIHAGRFEKYGGWERAREPTVNSLVAWEIWRDQGWAPWTAVEVCR